MIYLANLNLNKNEIQNAVLQPLAVAPASPNYGQFYTDSNDFKIKQWNGTQWKTVGVVVESSATNGNIVVDGVEMQVYELPMASASTLGGIKVGAGLTIDANGILSAAQGGVADSVEWTGVLNRPTAVSAFENDAGYLTQHQDISGKVDKVNGKGLSTNDYTTIEKNKLESIASGAEVNVNADWNAASGDAEILNKPTALSAFINDENFIDDTVANLVNYYKKSETYTQAEVNSLIGGIATISISVVNELPATGTSNIIYLVPKTGGTTSNVKDEYLWIDTAFEKIGDTEINLDGYITTTGELATTTVTFDTATTRVLPVSTEATANIIGKITRYLADLKTVAFTGNYADLSNKPREFVLLTAQIQAGQTSAFIETEYVPVSIKAHDSDTGETVMVDSMFDPHSTPHGITISIAQAYNHTIVVLATCPVSA